MALSSCNPILYNVIVSLYHFIYLQLLVQSVPITTKVVSSNPVHGEVYLIQHYVIKFVSDRHNIAEIFLNVALNTINLNHYIYSK
jgi:hypothetical protein